jgi:hypothetical protein
MVADYNAEVVQGATALADHAWPVLVAVIASMVIVCVTTVVLVFSVERGKRVEAIRALPDLIAVIIGRAPSQSIQSDRDTSTTPTGPVEREP